MADVVSISAGKMLSITIPVVKTGAADANGDFILTMYIVGNTDTLLKSQTYRTVQLKVNGAKYGLSANTNDVYRFIKLDLTDYGIVLTDKQTVAFFSSSDTLYPAYLGSGNTILNFLKNEFPRAVGYYNGAGKSTLKASANALLFDFEFERTYETKEERDMAVNYYDVLAAVKKAYGGKLFSVLGDSISTYDGFCNNSSVNSNLASNVKLYPYGNVADYTHTYWGALIGDTGMSLCVNNAWSGSHVVGTDKWSYADNMVYRAEQLARDSGEKPDVIFAFMSTNDLIHSKPLGSLYTLLSTNDGRSDSEKIEAWFSAVQRPASTKTAFAYWDEAYALSLQTMKQKYPDAEIFCMTLLPNTNSGYNTADRAKFNRCISALAEYFGANLIDLNESKIDSEHLSTTTVDGLHPNMIGFAEIEKTIIKALYKKISA